MKYQVIKLKTGQELCGMVSYKENTIEVTLPMICQLTKVTATNTLATFIPYNPLGNDSILTIGIDSVMHTSNMNDQFIPFYDEASAKWLSMVETGSIPLTNQLPSTREFLRERINDMMDNLSQEELDMLEEESLEPDYLSVEDTEKKIIH
tara:strand:+ start:336 stop:785 length:450 start_codon:yes stop_codon:yes gene_type:complete